MGKIKYPRSVKLVVGMIFAQDKFFHNAKKELIKKYGEVDFESYSLPFIYTNYYREEMGDRLWRKFISFKSLIDPEKIVTVKIFTNKLEEMFFFPGTSKRQVNIDPGYLDLAKLVLATTKDFAHRVYLDKGIYAEVTLRYSKDEGFRPWNWTYPDYRSREYLDVFNHIRKIYQRQLEEIEGRK